MATLDQAPPLPPEVAQTQASAPASIQALMGQMGSGGMQHGAVIQQSMQIEQAIMDLARMIPNFASVSDQIIQLLRTGVQNAIQTERTQGMTGSVPAGMQPAGLS